MKRLITNVLIFSVLLIFMGSCSENFLQPEPKSFFAPENVFLDRSGLEATLVTMKKNLLSEHAGQKDNISHQFHASETGSPLLQMDYTNLTPSTDRYQQFVNQLNNMFNYVKDANTVITRIDDIEWEDEQSRNKALAEALWHRSYWYYRMVHNYGDLPFVSEEVRGATLDYNTHSRWAILDRIQADMEFAIEYLSEAKGPHKITLGAGNHLLTKIYLANMEWDLAIEAATRVINGPYSLMTERFGEDADDPKRNLLWDLHRPYNKNISANNETILATVDRFEAPEEARTAGSYSMRIYTASWWHSNNRDSEGNVAFVRGGAMHDTLGNGNPDHAASDWHMYDIWEEDGYHWSNTPDLRRADINWIDKHEITINNPDSPDFGDPMKGEWMANPSDSVYTLFAWPFYKVYSPEQNPASLPNGGHADWYIYRLAETYLLRAEAYYWKGNLQAAADDINMIRERANAPLISAGDVDIDYIFDERARELYAEEPRQNELNRVSHIMAAQGINGYSPDNLHENNWFYDRVYNLNNLYHISPAPVVLGESPKIEPRHFQWPIDDGIINSNVFGTVNQNRGYAGAQNNEPPIEEIPEPGYQTGLAN
ncbi:Starch-binding associating with outer membrane [Fodinibius roseus]|uniref:Starch-binding associating with outer membrane n=1 Tax=Fodinibius roseus TaxID=1194090 RepID=A0A1M4W0M5_9BACT|nr:RagB/SusD family nutrient uptake outer membrane protein [Fodinibius roseus]SHE74766.1 Starch-binding associating with outer membrane [Fodinibius roseus]